MLEYSSLPARSVLRDESRGERGGRGSAQKPFWRGNPMHPVITASDCIGCGACIDACPAGVIELEDNVCTVVNEPDCIGCANCQDECPVGAITEIAE